MSCAASGDAGILPPKERLPTAPTTLERSDHTLYMMSECLRQLKRYDEAAHYGRLARELFEAQGVDDPVYSEILEDLSELDKLSD